MHKSIAPITITLTLVLAFATSSAHAQASYAGYAETNEPIAQTCRQLAQRAAIGFASMERADRVTCLDSNYITRASLDQVIAGFENDCVKTVVAKLGSRLDQEGDHDLELTNEELTSMFVDNYYPTYMEFCSTKNPGKGITTRPAARPPGSTN